MSKPSIPKGTRDFLPAVMAKRQYIFNTIKKVYKKYIYDLKLESKYEQLGYNLLLNEFDFSNDYHQYRILNYELNNPQKVYLTGWELDYQTRLWYLPSFLSGLVLNINYTTTNSEVQYPRTVIETYFDFDSFEFVQNNIDSAYTDRLIDQTDEIINVSIGYDFKGFSGRLSMLQNDDAFLATNFWPALRQHTDAYRRWDLSLKQTLPVDGLEIFLNASNLTETNDVTRYRGLSLKGDDLKLEQYYGKTIDFGFRYSF